jgi:cephalosporin hydroxylase
MAQSFWNYLDRVIIKSGGDPKKANLSRFLESLNHSLIFCPNANLTWLGVKIEKTPLDAFIFQEIIAEKRPDTIIECGTNFGGSAYFFATLFDLLKIDGKIITIDNVERTRPQHPKIEYVLSNCLLTDIKPVGKTMVILDCNHEADHVYQELIKFSPLVTSGQYLVVEDTDYPISRGRGPKRAVKQFLMDDNSFENDTTREKLCLSSNLGGWLLKK